MPALLDALPALYRDLLGEPFGEDVPPETKATCAACAMLEGGCRDAVAPVDGVPRLFRADTKCCTFHPRLPNYLVGAILADGALGEGRRRIEERLATRVGVTPGWLHPPRAFSLLYDSARHAFGRARGLRCPFYGEQGGTCTLWPYRDAVCSTYYCKYVAGEDGRRLWTAVKELLSLVEIQLSRAALLAVAPELLDREPWARSARPATLGPEDIDGDGPPAAEYRAAWGPWAGREAELYRRCHEHVTTLDAAAVEALLGLDGRLGRRALARDLAAARSRALPPVLRLDPRATVSWLPDGTVALAGYSELEAVALPAAAHRLLVRLTGDVPLAEARRRWREEERTDLSDEVLLELYRQRVLVAPAGA